MLTLMRARGRLAIVCAAAGAASLFYSLPALGGGGGAGGGATTTSTDASSTSTGDTSSSGTTAGPDGDHDGFSVAEGDCNDAAPNVHPGAAEVCNQIDDDCDGATDEIAGTLYVDADGDGYGDYHKPIFHACDKVGATSNNSDDCDDTDPDVHPGTNEISEVEAGRDLTCDGVINDESYDSGFGTGPEAVSGALLLGWLAVGTWRRRRAKLAEQQQ